MKRRELFRSLLGGGVVGSATRTLSDPQPTLAAEPSSSPGDRDPSSGSSEQQWAPEFLSPHQDLTLTMLSDLVIPDTETPGARAALVNRFIDRLLAAETGEVQSRFLESLAFVDSECLQRYDAAFVHLPQDTQTELLSLISHPHTLTTWGNNRSQFAGYKHFKHLQQWIARAYYSSAVGMRELGWTGSARRGEFRGCPHPDETHD